MRVWMSSLEAGKAFGGANGSQERNENCKYFIPIFLYKIFVYSLYIQINQQCSDRTMFNMILKKEMKLTGILYSA